MSATESQVRESNWLAAVNKGLTEICGEVEVDPYEMLFVMRMYRKGLTIKQAIDKLIVERCERGE